MSDKTDTRVEVQRFALAMEERLQANDHKGGWQGCDRRYLVRRLHEEMAELETALQKWPKAEVRREAADLANFAMMIADQFGDLDKFDHVHTTDHCDHVCDVCPVCQT